MTWILSLKLSFFIMLVDYMSLALGVNFYLCMLYSEKLIPMDVRMWSELYAMYRLNLCQTDKKLFRFTRVDQLFMLLYMQVPVGKAGARCPVIRQVPRESSLAFYVRWSSTPSKEIAKSIVRICSNITKIM